MTTKLMNNLLLHLKVGDFRAAPKGVGILTIMDAHNQGFVELEGTGRDTKCRLTLRGKAMRLRRKGIAKPKLDENQE